MQISIFSKDFLCKLLQDQIFPRNLPDLADSLTVGGVAVSSRALTKHIPKHKMVSDTFSHWQMRKEYLKHDYESVKK